MTGKSFGTGSLRGMIRWSVAGVVMMALVVDGGVARAQSALPFNSILVSGPVSGATYNKVAVDGSGNVFVIAGTDVREFPGSCLNGPNPSGCSPVTIISGIFSASRALAVDHSGNVFVGDGFSSAISMYPCGSGLSGPNPSCPASPVLLDVSNIASYIPQSLAVDSSGKLFVAAGTNYLWEFSCLATPASCSATRYSTSNYASVAVDNSGNVFAAGYTNVYEYPGSVLGGAPTSLPGSFSSIQSIAADNGGNVFVANAIANLAQMIPSGCGDDGCVLTLPGSYSNLRGVAVDGRGNVYVVDGHGLTKLSPELNFGSVAIGTASSSMEAQFAFVTGGAIGAPQALTLGAENQDFAINSADPGTCAADAAAGTPLTAGDTCTVNVIFSPKFAGERRGAVTLTDTSGNVIATEYVHGIGTGPQLAFNAPMPATLPTLGSGWGYTWNVAVDGAGNVYVTDYGRNEVDVMTPGCASSG
ncbi:MAG: SBBP repeat-containing protein, partial [Acidobacteriaceae bacterium]|nr:SBBP repeat-containing protein [Acidobacteriaceae bacterium]